jgi:hypothetical protein
MAIINQALDPKTGRLNIGLSFYQECQWLSAIKEYGSVIMNRSLLSIDQKTVLLKASRSKI